MDERPLSINSYHNIRSLLKDEQNYLGIDFSDKILLYTGKIAQGLKHNLYLLIGSLLLKAEQKIISNQPVYSITEISLLFSKYPSLKNVSDFLNQGHKPH